MISRKYSRNTPEGTRDMLFEECLARRKVASVLRELFESHGYAEVMTPGLEYYEMFAGEMAGIPQESLYKMTDGHGRLLVMRPDSTMPIARLAATRLKDAPLPLRLYYAQTVYRATPSMSGRSDEIMQSGIELLGAAGKRADLEVITMAVDALRALEVEDFRIELGHAGFYKALAARLPADDEVREEIRLLIESKNYAGLGALLDTLEDTEAVRALRRLPRLFGGREVFADAAALCEGDPDTLEPLRIWEGNSYRSGNARPQRQGEHRPGLGPPHRLLHRRGVPRLCRGGGTYGGVRRPLRPAARGIRQSHAGHRFWGG